MRKISRLAALLVASVIVSAPVLAQNKTYATVNGQPIPQSVYDAFITEQKEQGAKDGPELRNAVREELIRRELLAQEAKKRGLDKKDTVPGQVELAKQAVLIRAYLGDHMRANPITEERLKAEYETIKANIGGTEYKARHVLVEKEDEAKEIIARLDKGEKIADLAKQSKDPGSRDNGGDLGWNSPAAYVKPFGDALAQLKKGEHSKTPVQTDFGYHVIALEDTRPANPPPFDQVKQQLQNRLGQQQIEQLIKTLREKAQVN
ncbi:MAG: peptidyl-prolyl cis-trans isomerase [Betaproteobacteria bacterium]|nr:peptidyl-prolyl cis-trans isomerase [Betaproteobacteria bacterium]MCL2885896.1 peptidyl-prolyl cis-trans isomerase [Betaproteobacteria bacterium]